MTTLPPTLSSLIRVVLPFPLDDGQQSDTESESMSSAEEDSASSSSSTAEASSNLLSDSQARVAHFRSLQFYLFKLEMAQSDRARDLDNIRREDREGRSIQAFLRHRLNQDPGNTSIFNRLTKAEEAEDERVGRRHGLGVKGLPSRPGFAVCAVH